MWKWKIDCHAARPTLFSTLNPAGDSVSSMRAAMRRTAAIVAFRSCSDTVRRFSLCSLGITTTWPRVAGLMSITVTVRSSESTTSPGISPAITLQKMQSGSRMRRKVRASSSIVPRPMTLLAPETIDRQELRRLVDFLSAIERPSASDGERQAAEWIADRFRDTGLDPRVERERAHGGFWWPIGLLNAIALIAARLKSRLLALV